MSQSLAGKKVMILAASGAEEAELIAAQRDLGKAGATVHTVSPEAGLINCWNKQNWGLYLSIDKSIGTTLAADYDMLVVPGGSRSIAKLASSPHSERILSGFVAAKKPMAFMGDAITLLEAVGLKSAATEKNVLNGEEEDDSMAFVAGIIQHFSGVAPIKAAA